MIMNKIKKGTKKDIEIITNPKVSNTVFERLSLNTIKTVFVSILQGPMLRIF